MSNILIWLVNSNIESYIYLFWKKKRNTHEFNQSQLIFKPKKYPKHTFRTTCNLFNSFVGDSFGSLNPKEKYMGPSLGTNKVPATRNVKRLVNLS